MRAHVQRIGPVNKQMLRSCRDIHPLGASEDRLRAWRGISLALRMAHSAGRGPNREQQCSHRHHPCSAIGSHSHHTPRLAALGTCLYVQGTPFEKYAPDIQKSRMLQRTGDFRNGSRAPFRPTGQCGRSTPKTGPVCRSRRRVLWANSGHYVRLHVLIPYRSWMPPTRWQSA
jgi:hypothetical protein